ncbi:MAG: hypothetical protein JWN38_50 [Candidatus Saccharibacteria bacterium]|nr:hypothetical protein [Candidatus Saccharibacteria bacterium]
MATFSRLTPHKLTIILLLYAIATATLIAFGLYRDSAASAGQDDLGYAKPTVSFLFDQLAVLLAIYLVRVGLLIWPQYLRKPQWRPLTDTGIWCSMIVELVIIWYAAGLLTEKASTCRVLAQASEFGGCGWGVFIYLPIVVSVSLQLVGMVICFLFVKFDLHAPSQTI